MASYNDETRIILRGLIGQYGRMPTIAELDAACKAYDRAQVRYTRPERTKRGKFKAFFKV